MILTMDVIAILIGLVMFAALLVLLAAIERI